MPPSDFPYYSSVVTGHPKAPGFVVVLGTYGAVFDSDGVPVWWEDGVAAGGAGRPGYAEFLSPTTFAISEPNEFQLVGLNGAVQGTVGGGSVPLDTHDLGLLPNGNYLGIERTSRSGVDLSSWGLSSDSTIIDDDIVELTQPARSFGSGARLTTSTWRPRTSTGAASSPTCST